MVERTTDPNQLINVHGVGRLVDGDRVPPRPEPPAEPAPPVSVAERWWAFLFVGLVLAAILIGTLR